MLKNLLNRIINRIKISFVRDIGSMRLTFALMGRPFSRRIIVPAIVDGGEVDTGIKLNVGGGKGHPKLDDWKIVDLRDNADIVHDITKDPLPFNDEEVSIIFTSHTLEHIYPQQLDFVLEEFYRVLKPSGLIRILVPDINLAIKAYQEKNEQFFYDGDVGLDYKNVPIGGLLASWLYSTRIFKDPEALGGFGHVHCFDYDYLEYRLRRMGFKKVYKSNYRESIINELRGEEFDRHPHDSLCVEAIK